MGPETFVRAWQSDPGDWLGPFYLSIVINQLFLGILCCQVWTYHSDFPKDPIWLKGLVGLTFCLSIFKSTELFYVVWQSDIMDFGSWDKAMIVGWAIYMEPVVAALVSTSAQTFFVWRCYALTGWNRYLLFTLMVAMCVGVLLSAGLSVRLVVNRYDGVAIAKWALPMIVMTIVLDGVITLTVSYKLITSQRGINRNTDMILWKLLAVTWESALPPTIAQLGKIGVHFGTLARVPNWNYLISQITADLYVFSLMYCLNSRLSIRNFSLTMQAADYVDREPDMATEFSEIRFRSNQSSLISTDTEDDPFPGPGGASQSCSCQVAQNGAKSPLPNRRAP